MKKIRKTLTLFLSFTAIVISTSCSGQTSTTQGNKPDIVSEKTAYKVTFIELGSVRCIPCQQMQPVMKSIEQKYGKDVKVVFHDVWTEAGVPFAKQYGIEAIPTQVFLDKDGKEFFRHVGFFPEEELVKILKQKGVK
ncbi:MAG: thioredoxin family protein [Bacteroidales bacterium]